jgi:hypothetical protein
LTRSDAAAKLHRGGINVNDEPSPARSRRHGDRWLFWGIVALACWYVWAADTYTVFDDEAFSCLRYTMPTGEMVAALWNGAEPDPPLYYLIENLWVRFFGVAPFALRGPSILFMLTGLILLHEAARLWFDEAVAKWTFVVAALHPAHLFFGFAARWYALMFCLVAALLCATARLAAPGGRTRTLAILWGLCAAAVCYTNYFGPVVVGLLWLASIWKSGDRRRWWLAAACAALLIAPWTPPFWRQLTAFPRAEFSPSAMLSIAARTASALTTGNLASPAAWWAWAPVETGSLIIAVLALRGEANTRRLMAVVAGTFLVGVASRTMIDKYVLCFSGPACAVAAATVRRSWYANGRVPARIATVMIAAGWLGCAVHWLTESYWSSMRWLDPFERVVRECEDEPQTPPVGDWVVTHPSARYYVACSFAIDPSRPWYVDPRTWRRYAASPAGDNDGVARPGPATPRSMLARIALRPPTLVLTVGTAGFADDADWRRLEGELNRFYDPVWDREFLDDPVAKWKNRLDPAFFHPTKRIGVRLWRRWDATPP